MSNGAPWSNPSAGIASGGKYERIKMADVHSQARTATDMTRAQRAALAEAMRLMGQVLPIVVREIGQGYEVIDGCKRLEVMVEAGCDELDVVNVGVVTDSVAAQMHLALNLDRGKSKGVALADMLDTACPQADPVQVLATRACLPLVGKDTRAIIQKLRSAGQVAPPPVGQPQQASFISFRFKVPPAAAPIVDKACEHIVQSTGCKREMVLEYMAADYLSGATGQAVQVQAQGGGDDDQQL